MTLENAVERVQGLWTLSITDVERRITSDLDQVYVVVSSRRTGLFPVSPFSLDCVWVGTLAAGDVNGRLSVVFSLLSVAC